MQADQHRIEPAHGPDDTSPFHTAALSAPLLQQSHDFTQHIGVAVLRDPDLPAVNEQKEVAALSEELDVMGNDENCSALSGEITELLGHLLHVPVVQPAGRLIEDEDLSAAHQGAGYGDPLALTAGK